MPAPSIYDRSLDFYETVTLVCDDGYVSSLSILTCLTAELQCLISQGFLLLRIFVTICFYALLLVFICVATRCHVVNGGGNPMPIYSSIFGQMGIGIRQT